jgi:predicted HNH restriction endonuclease
VNSYERNPAARRACIAHYGTGCSVCGFNFGQVYGDLGEGYIHVHHLRDLATIGTEYEVDPIADLRPVCPNCHAMLHRETPAMSIEELKEIIEQSV